jgi:Thioredoxin
MRPLRGFSRIHLSGAQGKIRRHRQGAFCVPRVSVRPVSRSWFYAGALQRGAILPDAFGAVFVAIHLVQAEKPSDALFQISKQAGYTQEAFNACLKNTELLEKIRAVRKAGETIGVESTPTFFVNGEKYAGNRSIESFSAIIDPKL